MIKNWDLKKIFFTIGIIFLFSFSLLNADITPPNIAIGINGISTTYAQNDNNADTYGGIGINCLLGWRNPAFNGGYFSLSSNIDVSNYFLGINDINDFETISIETLIPSGKNRIGITGGFDSSYKGTGNYPEYFRPYYALKYYMIKGEKKIEPFFSYKGYYLLEPKYYEDSFYQGGVLGFNYEPSILHEYKLELGAGFEIFPEYYLYDSLGNKTGTIRKDNIVSTDLELNGLIGYFFDYNITANFSLRLSNANRYITAINYLDKNSESRLSLTLKSNFGWSPDRRINIQISPYTGYEPYIGRNALDINGNLKGEKLWILTAGTDIQADYTFNNKIYFILKGSGAKNISNDPNESGYSLNLSGGIEYDF